MREQSANAALVDLSALREKHDPVARNLVTIWRSELLALIEVAEASYAFLASDYEPQAHQRLNAALDLIDFGADRALAEAWGDYLDRHRDEIAENFERAAELIRAGDTHGLAEHVGRNRRARAEAAASDSHAATTLGPVRKKAWAIGGSRVRLINWRTTAYKGASLPRHIRWAPGSPDTLIIESPRRKYRLALRLRRNRG